MVEFSTLLSDERATIDFGQAIAASIELPTVIYLEGELGSGKTTLSRGLIRALGVDGAIKSPTYTLVEPYTSALGNIYHFDLYRLKDPEELFALDWDDAIADGLCLIEWPDKAGAYLPEKRIDIEIRTSDNDDTQRHLSIKDKRT